MDFDILQGFLNTEITYPEMYTAIRYFLTSCEIREGKFEANEYLINKIDRNTAIIYQEYETLTGWEYSQDARICVISELIKIIDKIAINNGFEIPVE